LSTNTFSLQFQYGFNWDTVDQFLEIIAKANPNFKSLNLHHTSLTSKGIRNFAKYSNDLEEINLDGVSYPMFPAEGYKAVAERYCIYYENE
jgi:hypothetical protein